MREDDEKALLTVATLAAGAVAALGALKAFSESVQEKREEVKREAEKKAVKLPVIQSGIVLNGANYTVYVNPYDVEKTTLWRGYYTEDDKNAGGRRREFKTEFRKCTDRELKEIHKVLWRSEWMTEDWQPVDSQTRGMILALMDEYIKRN